MSRSSSGVGGKVEARSPCDAHIIMMMMMMMMMMRIMRMMRMMLVNMVMMVMMTMIILRNCRESLFKVILELYF